MTFSQNIRHVPLALSQQRYLCLVCILFVSFNLLLLQGRQKGICHHLAHKNTTRLSIGCPVDLYGTARYKLNVSVWFY